MEKPHTFARRPWTRDLLFAPGTDDELVWRDDGGWLARRVGEPRPRRLPIQGEAATFFSLGDRTWLVTDREVLAWPPDGRGGQTSGLRFDADERDGRVALVAFGPADAFVVRVRARWLEVLDGPLGPPEGWTDLDDRFLRGRRVDVGAVGAPMRVTTGADGRFVAVAGAGTSVVVLDRNRGDDFALDADMDGGHPWWLALHPSRPLAALFSRELYLFDLEDRCRARKLDFGSRTNLGGEFTPDGRWLVFISGLGVVRYDVEERNVHHVAGAAPATVWSDEPIRISPSGARLLLAHDERVLAFRSSDFLGDKAVSIPKARSKSRSR